MLQDMNEKEKMILLALANGAKVNDFKHLNAELHNLHRYGYVKCHFDEQNHVITGSITSEGKAKVRK